MGKYIQPRWRAYYSKDALDEIAAVAKENGCGTHIDGARIFNASIAMV